MTIDQFVRLFVTVALVEMTAAIGLSTSVADLARVFADRRLMLRAAAANYLIVPAVTVGLLLWLQPHPMVSAGFLVLAVCPGAPFGPALTAAARGNVAVAAGLMVVLAGSSAIAAPLLLRWLLPLTSGGEPIAVDGLRILTTLLTTQLIPLCLGVAVRTLRPSSAARWQRPASHVSMLLNVVAVGLILATNGRMLLEIRLRGYLGMGALLTSSLAAGWLLGGLDDRRAMTLTTALRNIGVGLVITTTAFAGTPAVTATLAYGLFAILGTTLLALAWARRSAAPTT